MDDLDLEKLKQELHEVSGSSLYDVDQIMEEAGSSESGSSSSMEELMQSLGVNTPEEPKTQPLSASKPEEQEREALASLQQASEQTQAMIEEQEDMQTWLKPESDEKTEPAARPEEDDVFGSLFAQLGELEREEEIPTDPRTELMPEPEEEPSLMERLFSGESKSEQQAEQPEKQAEEQPEEQPEQATRRMEKQDYTELIDQATRRMEDSEELSEQPAEEQAEELPEEQKTETKAEPERPAWGDDAISQIMQALHTEEPAQEPVQDEEEPVKPSKQGLFSRLFAPPELEEDATSEQPEEEISEEQSDESEEQPKKGLLSRLFSPPDQLEEVDTPIDLTQLQGLDESAPTSEEEETQVLSSDSTEQPEESEPETQLLEEQSEQEQTPEQTTEQQPEPVQQEDNSLDEVLEELRAEIAEDGEESTEQPQAEQTPSASEPEPEQKKEPEPRPEDTPVISEDEFEAFMSDVDAEEEAERASFEKLLKDSEEESGTDKKKSPLRKETGIPETFPDKATTVYIELPVRNPEEEKKKAKKKAKKKKAQQPKPPKDEPLPIPAWLGKPLEEIVKMAPSLEELRKEGPVMTHEVLRCKERIAERERQYQEAEQQMETAEQPEPEEIHAADAWQEMHEQDKQEQETAEEDSVFLEGSTGTPVTEAVGQKASLEESVIEIQASASQPGQPEQEQTPHSEPEQPTAAPAKQTEIKIPQDLTQESQACRLRARNKEIRLVFLGILTLICIYISCAADFTILPLPSAMDYASHSSRVLGVFLLLMAGAAALAYDVVWDGIRAVLHLSPNFASLADAALVLNIVHCCIRLASEGEEIPFACIAMLILFVQLCAQIGEEKIRRDTYKVAGSAREPIGIFWHDGATPHLVKAPLADTNTFAKHIVLSEERKKLERLVTLSVLVIAVILSAIVCASTGDVGRLIYVLAATVTGSCQIALIAASVMARQSAASRLAHCGAASDSDKGADKMAQTETVVLTDEDLFPTGSVTLANLELHSSLNESTALAYAAALTQDSSLGSMLAEEVRTRYGKPLPVHQLTQYIGGVSGQIGRLEVLLGNQAFMTSRGVAVGDMADNALALSLDGDLAAIITVDYAVPAVLFHAMQKLMEQKTTIWLHSRNQQITPKLVEQLYDLPAGTVVVPDLEQNRALRNPAYTRDARLCALLVRDGLMGTADCICAARAQRKAQRTGILIGICASIVCMLLMMYLCYAFVPSDAHPIRLLIYMVLCFIPIFFLDNGVGRE